MCEILTMIKTDGTNIKKKDLSRFLYRALIASNTNKDGWGCMSEKWYMRNKEKMTDDDVKNILKEYNDDSRFFAVHVRIATCDVIQEYTHPFPYPSFIGMHNGVLSVDGKKSGSDSVDIFDAINDALKTDKATFYDALKIAIKSASGSYSILCYVDGESALYYVRNNPSFDFMYVKKNNVIYGATDDSRIKVFDYRELGFFETSLYSRPLSNVVYKIDLSNGRFSRLGTVEEKPTTYQYDFSKSDDKNENKKHRWGWARGRQSELYGSDGYTW